jgi:hypothetical protein
MAIVPTDKTGKVMSDGSSVLVCRAPHPRARRGDGRFEGRLCGKRLQVVPFRVRPTYRVLHDWSEVNPGCIAVRCLARDCRAFTEYEIIKDAQNPDEPVAAAFTALPESVTRAASRPALGRNAGR